MSVPFFIASAASLILLILLLICIKQNKRLAHENTIYSKRITQQSHDSSAKVLVFTRLSTILSSSFDRDRLLPQIANDLNSFFPDSQIRIILKSIHDKAVVIGKETSRTDVPFSSIVEISGDPQLSKSPLWEILLDDSSRLPFFYLFPLYVSEQISGYMLISQNSQIETRDYHFFNDIAVILSSILQNVLTVREKDFINEQFGRSVDPAVRDYLLTTKEDGRILPVSVLFFDIRNFTGLSEKIGAVQSVTLLNDIFSHCDDIIRKESGFINKFTGDGFMAVFGAPEISKDHEKQAVRAALTILQTVEIPCGMGIASGDAVAGTIGSEKRKEYTVIGDTVNTASRIESLCKLFGSALLISGTTMEKAHDEIAQSRYLGLIRLKGKKEPVSIYDLSSKSACYETAFTDAVSTYYHSDFSAAEEKLISLQKTYPDDKAIMWFLSRCSIRKNSQEAWDGIELMTEK